MRRTQHSRSRVHRPSRGRQGSIVADSSLQGAGSALQEGACHQSRQSRRHRLRKKSGPPCTDQTHRHQAPLHSRRSTGGCRHPRVHRNRQKYSRPIHQVPPRPQTRAAHRVMRNLFTPRHKAIWRQGGHVYGQKRKRRKRKENLGRGRRKIGKRKRKRKEGWRIFNDLARSNAPR